MASSKEIRGKIKSVENTKKITKAMEMVAASKMRKAQERMRSARPYAEKIGNIAANKGFLDDVDVKKVLAFESGLHQHLKSSHAGLLAKLEKDRAMDKDCLLYTSPSPRD